MLQMIITFFMFINAFLFTQTNHPMSMGMILLIQTCLTCLITGISSKNFWFSYILFLIFIGGMLILFMYMSSLASNEKMNFSINSLFKFSILMGLSILFLILLDKFITLNTFSNLNLHNFNNNNFLILENHLSLSSMYSQPNNLIVILLVLYLLLTLIMVVKITNLFAGPLRPKFN